MYSFVLLLSLYMENVKWKIYIHKYVKRKLKMTEKTKKGISKLLLYLFEKWCNTLVNVIIKLKNGAVVVIYFITVSSF